MIEYEFCKFVPKTFPNNIRIIDIRYSTNKADILIAIDFLWVQYHISRSIYELNFYVQL